MYDTCQKHILELKMQAVQGHQRGVWGQEGRKDWGTTEL